MLLDICWWLLDAAGPDAVTLVALVGLGLGAIAGVSVVVGLMYCFDWVCDLCESRPATCPAPAVDGTLRRVDRPHVVKGPPPDDEYAVPYSAHPFDNWPVS